MTEATMKPIPTNLIQLIEKAEEVFGREVRASGVLLTDIPEFYMDQGSKKVIAWMKAIKKELEDSQLQKNSH